MIRIDILARRRPSSAPGPEAAAVRWTIAPGFLLPDEGFTLLRRSNGVPSTLINEIRLPGAFKLGSGNWIIDDARLDQDHVARSAPSKTPPLPSLAGLRDLKPLIAFALPRPEEDMLEREIAAVAERLGDSHTQDIGLELTHWPNSAAPTRDDLAAMRFGTPLEQRAYIDIVDHYRHRATTMLLFFASDYAMAILLGLGWEDELSPAEIDPIRYEIRGIWQSHPHSRSTPLFSTGINWPEPPLLEPIVQGDALAGYPGLAQFFNAGTGWKAQGPSGDPKAEDLVKIALRGPRNCPTPTALLSWKPIPIERPNDEEPVWLLGRGAVAWRIERCEMGVPPGHEHAPAPTLDPTAKFLPCHDANPVQRGSLHQFEDDIDLPWDSAPLEGWYAYRICAIDPFGTVGPSSKPELVCLRDRYAPPPPQSRLSSGDESISITNSLNEATLALDWGVFNELAAPDAKEFRVYQRWTSIEYQSLDIQELVPITGALDSVQVDVLVSGADGRSLPNAQLSLLVGGTLLTPGGEFAILASRPSSSLRLRRSAGRAPPIGGAAARYALAREPSAKIARLVRSKATVGVVRVVSLDPLNLELYDDGGALLPAVNVPLYLHILGQTYAARAAGDRFVVDLSATTSKRARELYEYVTALGMGSAAALLDGSPALLLPAHDIVVPLDPPPGFVAGTVRFEVAAADGTTYVTTSHGTGNEGPRTELLVAARRPLQPASIESPRVPRLWASDAAQFLDTSQVTVTWPAMVGAVRYEVGRALESALGITPAASDDELIFAAVAATPHGFERVTNAAFLPRWDDQLPGRAPTRAIYCVRGVSASNTPGEWILVALVRVPDVRIAPSPTLLSAAALSEVERAVEFIWTQSGPLEGIGFEIEARGGIASTLGADEFGWKQVAYFLPGSVIANTQGRFSTVLPNREPGALLAYRIIPVRHALDPADPRAISIRRIHGRPSNVMRARALGDLQAPKGLSAVVSGYGLVTLRWKNLDQYASLELRRRSPGGLGLLRRKVNSSAEIFREPDALSEPGDWIYELAAIGNGRRALSGPVVISWSST